MGFLEFSEALKNGGPWVLLAASLWVNRYLFFELRNRDSEHRKELQSLNDRVVHTVQAQVTLLQNSNDNAQQLITALAALEEDGR